MPDEVLTGDTTKIIACFYFCWYLYHGYFFEYTSNLGMWFGVEHKVGNYICYWIFTESTDPIERTKFQPLTDEDIRTKNTRRKIVD